MLPPDAQPSWPELYARLGGPPPQRNRGQCLVHGGDSLTSVSLDHDRGLYHCHVCGAGGDRIDYIQRVLQTDFRGALRFLGVEPGRPPAPDPAVLRRQRARAGLQAWARRIGRELRREFRVRELVITRALSRLRRDAEDVWGWSWLGWALPGLPQLEDELDAIDTGTEEQILTAWREWRKAA